MAQATREMTGTDTEREARERGRRAIESVEDIPTNVYLGAVIGSILASAALFMMGRRDLGIFVGLWPPTILNLVMVTKRLKPSEEMR
jgi:hypothetical protein